MASPVVERLAPRPRQRSASEHLYFAVRSAGAYGGRHLLQYAFADDRGNVVLSAFTCSAGPAPAIAGAPAEDLAAEPLEPEAFEPLALSLCSGARLVAFHRVLQGGLLPPMAFRTAEGIDCAWRRFQRVAPARGLRLTRGEPLGLGECLALAGLPPPASEDAALRALAIRSLWRWLDDEE